MRSVALRHFGNAEDDSTDSNNNGIIEIDNANTDIETSQSDVNATPLKFNRSQFEGLLAYNAAVRTHSAKSNRSTKAFKRSYLDTDDDAADLTRIQEKLRNLELESRKIKPATPLKFQDSVFLERLNKELELQDQKLAELRLKDTAKKDSFPSLSGEAEEVVNKALNPRQNPSIPVVSGFNVDLMPHDLKTLSPATWLNDEIINFYGQLLMERSNRNPTGLYPKIHFFNTFFYTTLRDHGYDRVKRWSKKFDLFALDYVVIPVHLGMHWCCSVINFRDKRIEYYDSLRGDNQTLFRLYRDYLASESLDKKKCVFDFQGWTDYCPKDVPGQLNGFDCGVFTCMYAEYRSRNADFDFAQKFMPFIRRRMIYEICMKKLCVD
ncbi:SUMO1 sentrin specific peptidase 1 [Physocladia obscura]|uniref:SUMO1 sentrin specific peptidase 1 n=1 Tax=Physocladia obscura TaxID=109957 RepID=A0AAD5XJY4_9FUNG|nr:SUMO1 sentrin specific peptidase 1 [Physocladia obscura]